MWCKTGTGIGAIRFSATQSAPASVGVIRPENSVLTDSTVLTFPAHSSLIVYRGPVDSTGP